VNVVKMVIMTDRLSKPVITVFFHRDENNSCKR
jgi:hypothetical protein